uniref:WG repeat-containing protein n=1 Tax=Prevotella sp. TaxID=59823 RepID=UPI004027CCBD
MMPCEDSIRVSVVTLQRKKTKDMEIIKVRTKGDLGNTKNTVLITDPETGEFVTGREALLAEARDRKAHPERYAKWGIINEKGEEVLPLEYDSIWNFLDKGRLSTKVVKQGNEEEVFFHDLNPDIPLPSWAVHNEYRNDSYSDETYGSHYGEYAGSYAQDVMGYSDDIIDDAFDSDPDAYRNID